MSSLVLYQLPPSPNSIKVKLALNLKGVDHQTVDVDLADRSEIVKLSGQPLVPILKVTGDNGESEIIFDSFGIVRYLDANWTDGVRLFSLDRDAQRQIEEWEIFARTVLGGALRVAVSTILENRMDPKDFEAANAALVEPSLKLESVLEKSPYLMGDELNAADITVASMIHHTTMDPKVFADGILGEFAKHVQLPKDRPRTREWCRDVLVRGGVPKVSNMPLFTAA